MRRCGRGSSLQSRRSIRSGFARSGSAIIRGPHWRGCTASQLGTKRYPTPLHPQQQVCKTPRKANCQPKGSQLPAKTQPTRCFQLACTRSHKCDTYWSGIYSNKMLTICMLFPAQVQCTTPVKQCITACGIASGFGYSAVCKIQNRKSRGALDSAKNHERQRRKRQSVTAKREKSQTPKFV